MADQPGRERRRKVAAATNALRDLRVELAVLNHRVGNQVELKDLDFDCLDVIARDGQPAAGQELGDELREFCRQQGLAQWKVPREVRVVPDLDDELARGRHDEAPGAPSRPRPRVPQEVGEDGDQKRGRLSGAGLGLAGDIPAGQRNRERFGLDGRGVDEAGLGDALAHFWREVVAREFDSGEVVAGIGGSHRHKKSLSEPGTARPQSSTSGFFVA